MGAGGQGCAGLAGRERQKCLGHGRSASCRRGRCAGTSAGFVAQAGVDWPGQARRISASQRRAARDNAQILQQARARFPNVRLAFVSSRIYAGYARTGLNPEPYAYESGFAVRGLIALQAKDPDLNADPAKGEVKAPLALWGPYLWADGVKGRAIDDLVWNAGDFGADGTHPDEAGVRKWSSCCSTFSKPAPTPRRGLPARPPGNEIPRYVPLELSCTPGAGTIRRGLYVPAFSLEFPPQTLTRIYGQEK